MSFKLKTKFLIMKKNPKNINRRTFVGTTGALAAGFTLLPGSLITSQGRKAEGVNFINPDAGTPGKESPEGLSDEAKRLIPEEKWWEKEPLRIVEFEEGYAFREKFELLKDLGANMEHVTRFTDTSPGTSF